MSHQFLGGMKIEQHQFTGELSTVLGEAALFAAKEETQFSTMSLHQQWDAETGEHILTIYLARTKEPEVFRHPWDEDRSEEPPF